MQRVYPTKELRQLASRGYGASSEFSRGHGSDRFSRESQTRNVQTRVIAWLLILNSDISSD